MKHQGLPGGLVHEGKPGQTVYCGILGRNRRDKVRSCKVGVWFCLGIAIVVLVWNSYTAHVDLELMILQCQPPKSWEYRSVLLIG